MCLQWQPCIVVQIGFDKNRNKLVSKTKIKVLSSNPFGNLGIKLDIVSKHSKRYSAQNPQFCFFFPLCSPVFQLNKQRLAECFFPSFFFCRSPAVPRLPTIGVLFFCFFCGTRMSSTQLGGQRHRRLPAIHLWLQDSQSADRSGFPRRRPLGRHHGYPGKGRAVSQARAARHGRRRLENREEPDAGGSRRKEVCVSA